MQLNRLLEGKSFFHDFFILYRNHTVVHISRELGLFGLLLIVKSRISSAKRVHLIALAHLEAECPHLILHELVVQVTARAWILSDLL